MLVLESGDKLRGDASAAAVVDFTIHGIIGSIPTQFADGQLAAIIGDLYTSAGIVIVASITLVNTDSVARTVNLYLTPSGGTARRLIAKDLSLAAGYSLMFDGNKFEVIDTFGQIATTRTSALIGPAASTANAVVRFSGTTGKLAKDSTAVVIDDSNNMGVGTSDISLFNNAAGTSKLVVTGSSNDTDVRNNNDASIVIANTDDTANNTAGLHFAWHDLDGVTNFAAASIVAVLGAKTEDQYVTGSLHFLTSTAANVAPSEKMTILAGGNVGIGTASPTSPLTLSANTATLPTPDVATLLHIGQADGSGNVGMLIDGFGAPNPITFRRGNNTAASPSVLAANDVIMSLRGVGKITTGYSGSRCAIRMNASEIWSDTANGTYINFFTTAKTTTTLTERMRIDDAGNVGIGVTPNARLDVDGTFATSSELVHFEFTSAGNTVTALALCNKSNDANTGVALVFTPNINIPLASITALRTAAGGTTDLIFATYLSGGSVTEHMRILSNGNVGIGTTSPYSKLSLGATGGKIAAYEIADGSQFRGIGLANPGGVYGLGIWANVTPSDSNTAMFVGDSGKVGIGTGNVDPAGLLEVKGTVFFTGLGAASAGTTMVLVAGTNEVRPLLSSKEYKNSIVADFKIPDISNLSVKEFKWNESGEVDYGLIAEEAAEVCPEIVNFDKDKPISIKWATLTVLLLEKVQKLEKRIDVLGSRAVQ